MYKCPYCFNVYYRYFTFRIHLINRCNMNNLEFPVLLLTHSVTKSMIRRRGAPVSGRMRS